MNTMSFIKFEPDQPDPLEEGLIACKEKRFGTAARLFRDVARKSALEDRSALSGFLLHMLQEPPETEQEWLLYAKQAPTLRAKFSCLKIVLKSNTQHIQAWEEAITLCKLLADVSLKDALAWELWNSMQVGTPNTIAMSILSILTPEEELELGEHHATERRNAQTYPAELEGFPLRLFRDWAVTTGGIESLIAPYNIAWQMVWSPHWEEHIKEKSGLLGSYQDFLQALIFARAFFPIPANEHITGMAHAYKLQLLPEKKDWFESNRIHTALGGVRVRSKSEVIIANLLTMSQISFVYEQRLEAEDGTFRLPDFTFTWATHTYYWEHLGMLENVAYLERCDSRLRWYREHGFDDTLIVTTEVGGLDCDKLLVALQERLTTEGN